MPPRRIRIGHDRTGFTQKRGNEIPKVVPRSWILVRERERKQIMNRSHLGDSASEDTLRERVEQDRRPVARNARSQDRLAPHEP